MSSIYRRVILLEKCLNTEVSQYNKFISFFSDLSISNISQKTDTNHKLYYYKNNEVIFELDCQHHCLYVSDYLSQNVRSLYNAVNIDNANFLIAKYFSKYFKININSYESVMFSIFIKK